VAVNEDGLVVQRGSALLTARLILVGCGLKQNVTRFIPPLTVTPGGMGEALGISAACAEIS
jgi:4-aminobutyrate aminotransferase-like enzyme